MSNELFLEKWSEVKKVANAMCNKFHIDGMDKDDLMQEARLEVINTMKSYDESKGASFKTYYFYKLRSRLQVILSHVKTQKNYFNVKQYAANNDIGGEGEEDIFHYIASKDLNPEQKAIKDENMEYVYSKLSKLNKEFRIIVKLRSQGVSANEIGKKLGINFQQVFVRMRVIKDLFAHGADDQTIKDVNKRYNKLSKNKRKERKVT